MTLKDKLKMNPECLTFGEQTVIKFIKENNIELTDENIKLFYDLAVFLTWNY